MSANAMRRGSPSTTTVHASSSLSARTPRTALRSGARAVLDGHGLVDGPPVVLRAAQRPLDARARHLEQVRPGQLGAASSTGEIACDADGDRVEVDAALAVDGDPQRAGATAAGDLDVEQFEAERGEHGRDKAFDRREPRVQTHLQRFAQEKTWAEAHVTAPARPRHTNANRCIVAAPSGLGPAGGSAAARVTAFRAICARSPTGRVRGGSTAGACAAPPRCGSRPSSPRCRAGGRSPCTCSRAPGAASLRARGA